MRKNSKHNILYKWQGTQKNGGDYIKKEQALKE